jgi:hypothetical protein
MPRTEAEEVAHANAHRHNAQRNAALDAAHQAKADARDEAMSDRGAARDKALAELQGRAAPATATDSSRRIADALRAASTPEAAWKRRHEQIARDAELRDRAVAYAAAEQARVRDPRSSAEKIAGEDRHQRKV